MNKLVGLVVACLSLYACKPDCVTTPGYAAFMEECLTHLPYDDCWFNAYRSGKLVCE